MGVALCDFVRPASLCSLLWLQAEPAAAERQPLFGGML